MKISLKKLGLSLTVVSSSLLVACGNSSSNPLDNYSGIKLEDKTNVQQKNAETLPMNIFNVVDSVDATKDISALTFVEGQTSTYLVRITKFNPIITNYVVDMDFSSTERPTIAQTKDPSVYSITWTPRVGTIQDAQPMQQFDLKMQMTVTDATTTNVIGAVRRKNIYVFVTRTSAQPTIARIQGLESSTQVSEGVAKAFTVDVVDASNSPRPAELNFARYNSSNTEAYRADVARYVTCDEEVKKVDAKTFRFTCALEIDKLPLDRDRLGHEVPAATSVDVCFLMQAKSGVGASSGESQICAKGIYAAQPPALTFVDVSGAVSTQSTLEVKPGVETVLTVKMVTEHPLSVITVSSPDSLIKNLSGTKTISCTYDVEGKKNSQVCVVKWTPACVSKTATAVLTVKADATLDKKVKSSSITKTITITPDLEACPVKGGK